MSLGSNWFDDEPDDVTDLQPRARAYSPPLEPSWAERASESMNLAFAPLGAPLVPFAAAANDYVRSFGAPLFAPLIEAAGALAAPRGETACAEIGTHDGAARACVVDAENGIALVAARGDGSCFLHALLRAFNLRAAHMQTLRRVVAHQIFDDIVDDAARTLARADLEALRQLAAATDFVGDSDVLTRYVCDHMRVNLVTLFDDPDGSGYVALAGGGRLYSIGSLHGCGGATELSPGRDVIVLAHRGAAGARHWEVVGDFHERSTINMLFARAHPFIERLELLWAAAIAPVEPAAAFGGENAFSGENAAAFSGENAAAPSIADAIGGAAPQIVVMQAEH
jgi:hypothetical protein